MSGITKSGYIVKTSIIILGYLLACNVLAVAGDSFLVLGNNVNVREGPSLEYPVVLILHKGHKVMEFQRKGEWVEIRTDETGDKSGWIHSSLLGQESIDDPTKTTGNKIFQKFKTDFDELNARINKKMGITFFTQAEELGNGIIRVTATDAWVNTPKPDKANTIRILFELWDTAEGSGSPIAVYIVDKQGNQHMSMSR
jgi:SH3-like domain-containing protein